MKKLGETAEFTFQVAADEVGERRNGGQERNRNRASGTREVKERERQQKRNEFRTQMWKPEPGCSKMNLSWTMPARSGGNFRGKLCEMCVHSLPNVARRSPSTFRPLLFHPIFFSSSSFPILPTLFRHGERERITGSRDSGREGGSVLFNSRMRAATRRIFSYTRLDPVLRYFKLVRDVRRTCFEWGEWGIRTYRWKDIRVRCGDVASARCFARDLFTGENAPRESCSREVTKHLLR